MPVVAPPGWYETDDTSGMRYFDGARWTDFTRPWQGRPAGLEESLARHRPRRRRSVRRRRMRRVLVGLLLFAVVLGVVTLVLARTPGRAGDAFRQATGLGQRHRILPEVTATVPSSSFAFQSQNADGDPVRYDPCRPIHYAINAEGAPADYMSFVQSAVAAAETASGLQFVYDGLSSDRWVSRQSGVDERPVLITFADPAEVPGLAQREHGKRVAGLGGSLAVGSTGSPGVYVTGAIALSRSLFATLSASGDTAEARAIVMHELGHVLGLAHVPDPEQLMFADNVGVTAYAAGDLAGLAIAGGGPCS